mmetsp:Transcript_11099/g.17907  ORF Transcript_11099/g.17907 Transcript_11099/m.17907 type:complete len:112 (-) Transcript_11099:2995-3330(-)
MYNAISVDSLSLPSPPLSLSLSFPRFYLEREDDSSGGSPRMFLHRLSRCDGRKTVSRGINASLEVTLLPNSTLIPTIMKEPEDYTQETSKNVTQKRGWRMRREDDEKTSRP